MVYYVGLLEVAGTLGLVPFSFLIISEQKKTENILMFILKKTLTTRAHTRTHTRRSTDKRVHLYVRYAKVQAQPRPLSAQRKANGAVSVVRAGGVRHVDHALEIFTFTARMMSMNAPGPDAVGAMVIDPQLRLGLFNLADRLAPLRKR